MGNKLPVLDEAQQGVTLLEKKVISLSGAVDALDKKIILISQHLREIPKHQFDSKTPREANIPLQERSKLITELQQKQKQLESTNQKLATSIDRLKNARTQGNKKTSEEIVNNRLLARNADRAAKANSKLLSVYERLTAGMNKVGRTVQNLNAKRAQGIKLSNAEQRELKQSTARFNKYKTAVDVADRSIGRFQRNVGNYGIALGGLAKTFRSLVGALGASSGIYAFVSIMRSGITIVREFGASMANLAGIFRVTRDDLAPLEAEIIAVAGASVKTATEVAKLAEALATLGKTKDEISDLLKPVNDLSIGLEATSQETAEFLVQTINAFGGSSKEALKYADTIATIRTSTSLNFQKMRDSFQYLTPISQILNKDLAYTGALIGIVADSGVKAERAGRLLGTAQQRLAKDGNTLAWALEQVNEASAKGVKEENLLAIASELFGKQAASLGIILAQNSDIIETNAQAIRDNGGALDDLVNEQLKSLDASLKIFKSRWEQYILNTDEATGSSERLITIIKFLADNLSTIINTILTVIGAFVAYKAIIISVGFVKKTLTAFTIAYRIALVAMNKGLLNTIKSMRLLKVALINTGIGALIIAVVAVTVALYNMNKELSKSEKQQRLLSDAQKEASKSIAKEKSELDTLVKVAKNENLSKEQRLKAIEKLNKISPDYLGNIALETINTEGATTAIDNYVKALDQKALAQALVNKKAELYQDLIEAESSSIEDNIDWHEKLWNSFSSGRSSYTAAAKDLRTGTENRNKAVEGIKDEISALDELIRKKSESGEVDVTGGDSTTSSGGSNSAKKQKEVQKALEGSVGFYEEYITLLKKEQSTLATTSESYKAYSESIKQVQEAIETIKDVGGLDVIFDEINALESDADAEGLGEEIAQQIGEGISSGLQKLANTLDLDIEELYDEFDDLYKWDYENFLKFSEKKIAQAEIEDEKKKQALIDTLDNTVKLTNALGDIGSVLFDRKIQQYDDEIQANDDYYAKILDNENLSEEQRSALEAERERKNAELEKKKRNEQRKQAEFNKAIAIFETIVNTASGVVEALPNIPLAVLTGVLGAAQLAVIAATPIPKYKHGRTGGKAEFAFVGDGGVSEIIERAKGGYEITPSTDTLTYLGQGDKVHPNADKFLQEQAYNMSLSAQGRTIERVQVNNNLTKKDLDSHAAQLVKAMSQNKANIRIHNDNRIGDELKFLNRLNDVL